MRHLPLLAAWALAVLLVAATFASGEAAAQAKLSSPDASITSHVVGAFARDPSLKAMAIHVETQSGVVNLSGFVRSVEDIAKADELARRVSGVAAVRNGLRVADRPSRA